MEALHDRRILWLQGPTTVEPLFAAAEVFSLAPWLGRARVLLGGRLLGEPPALGRLSRGGRRRLVLGRLSSTTRLKHFCCIGGLVRRAHQELDIHVATVGHLRDVVAGAPERLVAFYLAAAPLVEVISDVDEQRPDQRLAAPTHSLDAGSQT